MTSVIVRYLLAVKCVHACDDTSDMMDVVQNDAKLRIVDVKTLAVVSGGLRVDYRAWNCVYGFCCGW